MNTKIASTIIAAMLGLAAVSAQAAVHVVTDEPNETALCVVSPQALLDSHTATAYCMHIPALGNYLPTGVTPPGTGPDPLPGTIPTLSAKANP
jgi:hypothetical protein